MILRKWGNKFCNDEKGGFLNFSLSDRGCHSVFMYGNSGGGFLEDSMVVDNLAAACLFIIITTIGYSLETSQSRAESINWNVFSSSLWLFCCKQCDLILCWSMKNILDTGQE